MRKKNFLLMIVLVSLGLIGLIVMQAYFLHESYKMKTELFDRSVNSALSNVVNKLEKVDAVRFIHNRVQAPRFPALPKIKKRKLEQFEQQLPAESPGHPHELRMLNPRVEVFKIDTGEEAKMIVRYNDNEEVMAIPRSHNPKHKLKNKSFINGRMLRLRGAPRDSIIKMYHEEPKFLIAPNPQVNLEKKIILRNPKPKEDFLVESYLDSISAFNQRVQVFEKLANEWQQKRISINERADPKLLDSLLHKELKNAGIGLAFNFNVTNNQDSVIFRKASKNQFPKVSKSQYRTALFPNEVMNESGFLTVSFPGKDDFLWKKISFLMISTGLIILLILSCFVLTIYYLFRQKKLSEMKTDFINNMTHEFKTPVATIMLASEALRDDDMASEQALVKRYASIIYDENLRLSSYVERVLNVARLERSDLKLEHKSIPMNDLIQAVADSMALQFSKRKAGLKLNLKAAQTIISGDEMHLSNVIYNLLDNALKYSEVNPEVSISTFNAYQKFHVVISDKGIGMTKEQQSRIFDQFYRAHTGNVHDIKGFGLGLHYVHSIIKLLGGSIKVKSEQGKGSSFEVILPLDKINC